ncbi:MAG: STAS domain-containing protein [Prolixibacteraceae bacterium]|jgi:anti-anti-sigma factor|nr:STAS domain-containing protein [Prolixibacteraceae bacterium]
MNFSVLKYGSYTCITVCNKKLDAAMAPDIKAEFAGIIGNGERNILVDLTDCSYCDSSGLSALLLGNRLCNNASGSFVLFGLTSRVKGMIDLIGFESVLKVAETRDAAKRML